MRSFREAGRGVRGGSSRTEPEVGGFLAFGGRPGEPRRSLFASCLSNSSIKPASPHGCPVLVASLNSLEESEATTFQWIAEPATFSWLDLKQAGPPKDRCPCAPRESPCGERPLATVVRGEGWDQDRPLRGRSLTKRRLTNNPQRADDGGMNEKGDGCPFSLFGTVKAETSREMLLGCAAPRQAISRRGHP